MRNLLVVAIAMVSTACAVTVTVRPAYLEVPTGSRFILTQAVSIPAGEAGVYINNGAAVSSKQISSYYPHCRFESMTVLDTSQSVGADQFNLIKAKRDEEVISANGIFSGHLMSSSIVNYSTTFILRGVKQQNTFHLVCQHWGDSNDMEHLTLEQIRTVLGDLIKIETAAVR